MNIINGQKPNRYEEQDKFLLASKEVKEKLPCDKCNGDCCGVVPFSESELVRIFNNYKGKAFLKRFPWNENTVNKHLKFREAFPSAPGEESEDVRVIVEFRTKAHYRKRGLRLDSCIFKDNEETGGCLVYEDRPLVCREYGKRELLKCPYTGLDEQPKDMEERKRLVREFHQYRNDQLLKENYFGRL